MDLQCFLPVYPNFELQQISPDFLSKTIIALLLLISRLERILKKNKQFHTVIGLFLESIFLQFLFPCLISVWKCFVINVLFTTWWLLQASINCEHDSPWCMSFLNQWQVHFPNSAALYLSKPSGLPRWVRKKQYLDLFPTEVSIFAKTKSWEYPHGMPSVLVFESLPESHFTAKRWLLGITDTEIPQGGFQSWNWLM